MSTKTRTHWPRPELLEAASEAADAHLSASAKAGGRVRRCRARGVVASPSERNVLGALRKAQTRNKDASHRLAEMADRDCLMRVAAGETAPFAELVRRYQDRVTNLVYRVVGDWDAALDLAQEAFLRIHQRISTFKPEGNARAWMLTIAVNVARDYLRKRSRIVYLDSVEGMNPRQRGSVPSTPPELLEQEELRGRVREAIGRMPEFPRTVVLLRDFEGLTYEEMSEVLDCEVGTVKSRLHRARKQFQDIFKELSNDR